MTLSDEKIQEIKNLLEKKGDREYTWDEASEAARNLEQLVHLLFDCWVEDQKRKKKLEESPKGFVLDGVGYSCFICGQGTQAGQNWYDKYGIKCTICQSAIDRKEIPATLAKNKDSWYTKYDLESSFNLKGPGLRSWIKKGIIKARTVTYDGKGVHTQLFLIKDNKDFLPPKKLVESHSVKETKDDKEWFTIRPWYHFFDPVEHLKGYKIMDHMKVTHEEKEDLAEEVKKQTMKIKELFKIGGIMQSIDGKSEYLDQNNCVVKNKTKNEEAVILHLKRESDGEEGNAYLRVRDEFKDIATPLLRWAFSSDKVMNLTLNQLTDMETGLEINRVGRKLSLNVK